MTETRTTCPYCGVGCGLRVTRDDAGAVTVTGDPDHPANFGRLCSKGSALGETLSLQGRLTHPMINGTRVPWDRALDHVAARFRDTIAEHGPDSVAFYVSGQLLTEDYYVANKLMKGFIGSANIDTNSRLCMASSVVGHKRAFGSDTVPGVYEAIEQADLVVLVGSNLAWRHPVLFQRLAAAREERGTKVVVIDPRRTATCEIADPHLPIAPGGDVMLFNGLLAYLDQVGAVDHDWVGRHVNGFTEAMAVAIASAAKAPPVMVAEGPPSTTWSTTHAKVVNDGPSPAVTRECNTLDATPFYDLFARTPRVVTIYSQGVNQAADGTDRVNAIINCHLATGRIGRPVVGPFSVTGQPNAMGGRETGGLATMLAARDDAEASAFHAAARAAIPRPDRAASSGNAASPHERNDADFPSRCPRHSAGDSQPRRRAGVRSWRRSPRRNRTARFPRSPHGCRRRP
jgi:assimilatory nitrate reductase catalytic subunit